MPMRSSKIAMPCMSKVILSHGPRAVLRRIVGAVLEELRPRELERLEPRGEGLDLIGDALVSVLV